jgi:hypothetical protein
MKNAIGRRGATPSRSWRPDTILVGLRTPGEMSSTIADELVFVDTNILVYAYDRAME